MAQLTFPPSINAGGFLGFLGMLSHCDRLEENLEFDLSHLRSVSPAALVVLSACVQRWIRAGRDVHFAGLGKCAILGYLQRMDLFRVCGGILAESFTRHDGKGRFVEIQEIGYDVDALSVDVAQCLAPVGENHDETLWDLNETIQYIFTETAYNVRQHSRGIGYAAAQVRSSEGLVRLAIADNGIGILETFKRAGFTWAQNCDDAIAMAKALEPRISSRGSPSNEGVGLTTVAKLAELFNGWFALVSGDAIASASPGSPPVVRMLPSGTRYHGTLITLALRSDEVRDYPDKLSKAKIAIGLLPPDFSGGRFLP